MKILQKAEENHCRSGSRGTKGAMPPPPPACKKIVIKKIAPKCGGLYLMFLASPLSEVSGSSTAFE